VRGSLRQILTATFGLAALLIIVEHAGGFSRILESGAGAYATGFAALTGHAAPSRVASSQSTGIRYTAGTARGYA
jgi:hypothetical protein